MKKPADVLRPGVAPLAWADALAAATLFLLVVFVLLAPLLSASGASDHAAGEGNLLRQAIYVGILGAALAVALQGATLRGLLVVPASIMVALAWCALSLAWSADAGIGARRLLLTGMVLWSVFLLVHANGYARSVSIVRSVLLLVLVANFAAVLLWPEHSIHQLGAEADPSIVGAWHGILPQKNYAGAACAFTIIFFALDARRVPGALRVGAIGAAAVFLFFTNSKTSTAVLLSAVALGYGYRFYSPYFRVAAVAAVLLVLGLAGIVLLEFKDMIADYVMDPRALTGRVQIWDALLQYALAHPLLGAGFGSFWNVADPQPISHYAQGWVTGITSGHNGYLDLLVQLGLPGLGLALLALVVLPLFMFLWRPAPDRARAGLLLACIWFGAWHNLSETSLLDRDAAVHVFMLLAIALQAREHTAPSEKATA